MKKLAIMSDLHIDSNQFGQDEIDTLIHTLKEQDVVHLHLAGDISNHHVKETLPFLDQLRQHLDVSYNLGNHDMLGMDEAAIQAENFQLLNIGQRQLLAFHGWYDYSFSNEAYDRILRRKNLWFDRRLTRNGTDQDIFTSEILQLERKLDSIERDELIVAMHFVPHSDFTMWHEKFAPFNAFLGSQAFHELFVRYQVPDVVFGHTHRSYGTVEIDGVRYHSRPLGYMREWDLTIDFVNQHPHLNPSQTWNLSKRYNLIKNNPLYQAHKKEKFKNELLGSMTLFEVG